MQPERSTGMGAVKGRRQRPPSAVSATLYARVAPERHAKAQAAAAALGVALATYLDELIGRDEVDANGRPVWWPDEASSEQEELPLTKVS